MAKSSDEIVHDPEGGIERLIEIMRRLRDPATGCPWDIEQSFATIAPYTIEEAYEVADAIEREAWGELRGELGDLLFQAVFHARMAEERGLFDIHDVARGMADKMVARHPHVFGDRAGIDSAAAQTEHWEALKAEERAARAEHGVLDGVAIGLPALLRACKLQKRAARVGFDWPQAQGVAEKIAEEARELAAAGTDEERREEIGDMLFSLVNLARHLGVEPEAALRHANAKFIRRFKAVEAGLEAIGKRPEESDLEEMDALWNAAKARE